MAVESKAQWLNFWVVFQRATGVDGEWTAHILDFDIVTQSGSLGGAWSAMEECCASLLADPGHDLQPLELCDGAWVEEVPQFGHRRLNPSCFPW